MNISSISPNFYNQKSQTKPYNTSFTGLTNNKVYTAIEENVAKNCVKLVNRSWVKNLILKTDKSKVNSDKLSGHLMVLGSTLLSGFYIGKTLKNKNMDEDKRKTLAINQALVYGASTVMAYSFDNWLGAKFKKIVGNFERVNYEANKNILREDMEKWKTGLGLAKKIIIIDMVYRFIAPVIVTPLANYIGNELNKNKKTT